MSAPVCVAVERSLRATREQVGEQILDLENWPNFAGYGPLPGIRSARFRARTPEVVGTVIVVENRDGSGHCEEVVTWTEDEIALRFSEFTPPLSSFASHFLERWTFRPEADGVRVVRAFELYPRSLLGAMALRAVAPMLRRAAALHLDGLAG